MRCPPELQAPTRCGLQRALEVSGRRMGEHHGPARRTYLRAGIVNYLSTEDDVDRMLATCDACQKASSKSSTSTDTGGPGPPGADARDVESDGAGARPRGEQERLGHGPHLRLLAGRHRLPTRAVRRVRGAAPSPRRTRARRRGERRGPARRSGTASCARPGDSHDPRTAPRRVLTGRAQGWRASSRGDATPRATTPAEVRRFRGGVGDRGGLVAASELFDVDVAACHDPDVRHESRGPEHVPHPGVRQVPPAPIRRPGS